MNKLIDCKGREILPGDLVKMFHFKDRRWGKRYMYKYAQEYWLKDGVRVGIVFSHLEQKGETFRQLFGDTAKEQWEIIQGYGDDSTPFFDRPRIKQESSPANEVRHD